MKAFVLLALATFPTWMAGSWQLESNGTKVEEHWTAPAGGIMLGMSRTVGRKTAFEFLRVVESGDTLAYVAMPQAGPATTFPLESAEADRVVFENAEHDFPQRILYWRAGEKLCARIEGTVGDKVESEEWCYSPMGTPSP